MTRKLISSGSTFERDIGYSRADARCRLTDVVRVRYILPERDDFPKCWPVLQRYLGDIRPAATMIVAGLSDPRMKIEIEVTTRRQKRRKAADPTIRP